MSTTNTLSAADGLVDRKEIDTETSKEAAEVSKENEPRTEGSPAAEAVTLDPHEDPLNKSRFRKWVIVVVISSASLCVTCCSSIAGFTEAGMASEFHVSKEATILGISLFVEGLGWGPLLVAPLSEMYGRNIVYRVSYAILFALTWPIVFAPNLPVYLVFRFLTGFSGSAFLSVAGGSVSDLFTNDTVGNPMAVYTMSPFIGPVLGPLLGGYATLSLAPFLLIDTNLNWRWTYRVLICWIFAEMIALFLLVPETYHPVLLKFKAQRLRKTTGNPNYRAPLENRDRHIAQDILVSCYRPFQLMYYDRMALLLNMWNALLLGILYLTFQAFPVIFEQGHGFNIQSTGMSFLGIGLGMLIGISSQPIWNRVYARAIVKYNGSPPPEVRLYMGMVGGVLVPLGLFWLAFTTYPSVHWIVPIIASVLFGTGTLFVFTSTFTYLVTAYRPIAASAMASNSAMRSAFAAVFPLFAPAMYNRLGTVGATALLAGLATLMAPLPFVFFRIGQRLRERSRFAVSST
ncbi:hypothetical protein PLICRDRAFT_47737 [Plicaturopsis crispa FD-325 SS-3]|nr:hypothetical protein PLICRDRAFT_47737 [Plicaturopsis crispa FD-325 SS-3]